jgi:hypothetical protein
MNMENEPEAYVTEVDGQLVLVDPMACAIVDVVNQHNRTLCSKTLEAQLDRVRHFTRRIMELGKDPADVSIVLLNVDDPLGGPIADSLMPGHDWQQYRDRGEVPFARGLAGREGMQSVLDEFSPAEGAKLRAAGSAVTVIVMDHGVVEVFVGIERPSGIPQFLERT